MSSQRWRVLFSSPEMQWQRTIHITSLFTKLSLLFTRIIPEIFEVTKFIWRFYIKYLRSTDDVRLKYSQFLKNTTKLQHKSGNSSIFINISLHIIAVNVLLRLAQQVFVLRKVKTLTSHCWPWESSSRVSQIQNM